MALRNAAVVVYRNPHGNWNLEHSLTGIVLTAARVTLRCLVTEDPVAGPDHVDHWLNWHEVAAVVRTHMRACELQHYA